MVDMDTFKTLDLALRIGEMQLSNGAGAADVTATMLSVTQACGLRGVTPDVTFTELSLNHQPSLDDPGVIQVRRIEHREVDYEDLTVVDHLVQDLLANRISRDEARAKLSRVASAGHRRPRWAIALGWGGVGAGTALLLGGGVVVTVVAFFAAMAIDQLQRVMSRRQLPGFYQQVAGGLLATLFAIGVAALDIGVEPSRVVTAGIIMLLAGIGFVGATQDALTGFPLTAGARILEALLATAGIIAGVSGGLTFGRIAGVDLGYLAPGAVSPAQASLMTLGAMLASGAFAFAAYAPLRSVLPIALVAGVGIVIYTFASAAELGPAWSTAFAAIAVGAVSFSVASRVRVPQLVVVVPAVLPLLPGLAIYRGLTYLAEGQGGTLQLAGAGAIAIAIASGVLLGQHLAQPLRRDLRRLEDRLTGPRLVGPLRDRATPLLRRTTTMSGGAGASSVTTGPHGASGRAADQAVRRSRVTGRPKPRATTPRPPARGPGPR